ncbi:class I SAM-dependent methyltransferase [Brunnivagina elsteri]|uniref:SAM-dependent methyltransferase n=1 Tax=Brunnivagina elsteri CCALA 953 TaxID=987040 RepID=A0A2A2TB23_9CYAN|nr:class I SAM-dependent methyltransferase [Calothrix elsteri]PAX50990.1 SAM-dependent methyltransferase [Calothrix elsteri CCALA 953]
MSDTQKVSDAVAKLYDTYPFPPEPILDEPPPGYNWRWDWLAAYNFCTGMKPQKQNIRILDAGCGSGVSTEYLVHLNPNAEVVGIDLSAGTLEVARERCQRSGANRAEFHQLSLFDVEQLPGKFDLINCVGVLHHTNDPIRGIQTLAKKLAPGGIFHIFVYGELGRWEIQLMQKAIALLQGEQKGDYRDGVAVGRQIFKSLPEHNRILKRERERWSLENHRDENFADMYVHPQEIDYNIDTLFDLIDASGLEFLGFSNPAFWDLQRLLSKAPELIDRTKNLSQRQLYRLIELLDPETSHYEFFLACPPLTKADWQNDQILLAAIPEVNHCIDGFPSQVIFNYDYKIVNLSDREFTFMQACDGKLTVGEILPTVEFSLDEVRSLQRQQLIMLTPA